MTELSTCQAAESWKDVSWRLEIVKTAIRFIYFSRIDNEA